MRGLTQCQQFEESFAPLIVSFRSLHPCFRRDRPSDGFHVRPHTSPPMRSRTFSLSGGVILLATRRSSPSWIPGSKKTRAFRCLEKRVRFRFLLYPWSPRSCPGVRLPMLQAIFLTPPFGGHPCPSDPPFHQWRAVPCHHFRVIQLRRSHVRGSSPPPGRTVYVKTWLLNSFP